MSIEEITHPTVLEVNLQALKKNVTHFRNHLKPSTKLCCMVKAEAYGMGAISIAKALEESCDYLAVAFAREGVELRQAGITLPIIVLDPTIDVAPLLVNYQLEPEVYSLTFLEQLTTAFQHMNVKNHPIHIKIDSGMHRAGFQQQEIRPLLAQLSKSPQVKVLSIFSHLVGSDDAHFDDFTHEQIAYFKTCADEISTSLPYPTFRHILNSAGIERFPEEQMDMVRLGIGLWGISATKAPLANVVSLKSTVTQLRQVSQSETVGYSRKGTLSRNSTIALVPVGYADGIDRRFGNGHLHVEINDIKCPTVGNICMDLMMIDVTDVPDIAIGDTVTIFGDNQPVQDLSSKLGTIPYEILTGISPRVTRRYI